MNSPNAKNRPPKHKRKGHTDYTLEDLTDPSAFEDQLSFLRNIPPERAAAAGIVLPFLSRRPGELPPGMSSPGVLSEGEFTASDGREDLPPDPLCPDSPLARTPVGSLGLPFSNQPKARRARTAQDGHSEGEERIYELLWRAGKAETADDDRRLVRASQAQLAVSARMDISNVRRNTRSLCDKLALEEIAPATRSGQATLYRVHSYRSILERRRAAGMEWVVKGRGVRFVPPPAEAEAPGELPPGTSPLLNNPPPGNLPPIASSSRPRNLPGLIIEERLNTTGRLEKPPAAAPAAIVRALRESLGRSDDALALRITEKCRENAPDATEEEIAHFVRLEIPNLIRDRTIRSVTGVLPTRVATCFRGESLRQFREQRQSAEQAERAKNLESARIILAEPHEWGEDQLAWAEQILRENT
jgi:hypothetical protein